MIRLPDKILSFYLIVVGLILISVFRPIPAFSLSTVDGEAIPIDNSAIVLGQSAQSQKKKIASKSSSAGKSLAPITLVKKGYTSFLHAQNFGPVICTDRNSVTPHPNVVPLGYFQIESGSTFEKNSRGGDIIFPETVLRLGTWYDGEVRFQVPNYITSSGTLGRFHGDTDIQLSIKQEVDRHLFKIKGLDIGVIAGLTLPTGTRNLTTTSVDPFVQIISFYRYKNTTFGTSHSIFVPGQLPDDDVLFQKTGRSIAYQPTAIVFRHLKLGKADFENVDAWIEYAGYFPEDNYSRQLIDMGAVWRPVRRHQVDLRIGFGLNQNSPRALIGVGYSWLPGKVIPFYKRAPEHTYRP